MVRFLLRIGLLACLSGTSVAAKPLKIYTVNYPLAYFAERIAGDHAEVVFPAQTGSDPAFWKPPIAVISEYQQADLILLNGADYAQWISKVSLPRSRLVNTSKAFSDRYIEIENVATHSHGAKGEHSHTGTASTTWLDFQQAALQAKTVTEALTRKRPELKGTFEQNFTALEQELMALDRQLTELVENHPRQPLLASHPVYQYFARRYQLNLPSMQWEPQEVPDDAQWTALEALLKEHPARWMIWEAEPAAQSVARLADMGVESLVFDPCANVPQEGDWLSVMRRNIDNLKPVFSQL